jgi:hypothetical protein
MQRSYRRWVFIKKKFVESKCWKLIIYINSKRSPDKTTLASGGDDNNLVLLDLRKY